MTVIDWIWLFLATSVSSSPIPDVRSETLQRAPLIRGEPWEARVAFSITTKVCIGTMAALLGMNDAEDA
jgi:hypothetical protein